MYLPASKLRTLALMTVAMTAVTFGDIFLAQAMKAVGEVRLEGVAQVLGLGRRIFSEPKVWLALVLMTTFFFIWLTVLSWEDLSFVLPLTALTYLMNALLVGPFLGEHVGLLRWSGTLLIGLGVVLVTLSGSEANAPRGKPGRPEGAP